MNQGILLRSAVLGALALFFGGLFAENLSITLDPGAPSLPLGQTVSLEDGGSKVDEDILKKGIFILPPSPETWIFSPGETVSLKIFSSNAPSPECQALLTVWDWNNEIRAAKKFSIPFADTVDFSVRGRGTYLLTLDLLKDGVLQSRLARSFAVLPSNEKKRAVWSAGEYFLGSCIYPSRYNWKNAYGSYGLPGLNPEASLDLELAADARLGLTVERIDVDALATPAPPTDFTKLDKVVKTISERGFKLSYKLAPTANQKWMISEKYKNAPEAIWKYPPDENLYRDFVKAFALRYRKTAQFYEVYNEPDNAGFWLGTMEEYISLFKIAVEAVKSVDPTGVVVNGGLTPGVNEGEKADRRKSEVIIRGTGPLSPLMAYHLHGPIGRAEEFFRWIRTTMAASGVKIPTVQTEGGDCAWKLDRERQQAVTVMQKIFFTWANGSRGWLLYATRFQGGPRIQISPKNQGTPAGWGYLDYFYCPRFLYGTLGAFIDLFAGATYERTLREDDLHLYLFNAPKGKFLVGFRENPSGAVEAKVTSDATSVTRFDPMGNATKLTKSNVYTFLVTDFPTSVFFEGQKNMTIKNE